MTEVQRHGIEKPAKSPTRRILALCIGIAAVASAICVLTCAAMLTLECFRPIPAPNLKVSTSQLLKPQAETTVRLAIAAADRPTSGPTAIMPDGPLHYAPMIPDEPDIPPGVKARAAELNVRFESIFRRIADYDRMKQALPPQEAARMVKRIAEDYRKAFGQLWDAAGQRMIRNGGCKLILDRNNEYLKWYYPADIECRERTQQWLAAAGLSRQYWDFQRGEWEVVQWAQDPMHPVFNSDYDRQSNYQDYRQVLYYYRKTGGMNGVVHIGELLYEQKKRELYDRWQRIKLR